MEMRWPSRTAGIVLAAPQGDEGPCLERAWSSEPEEFLQLSLVG
jgi:hypothetical protein